MSASRPTPLPRDSAREIKRLLRMGLDTFGISRPELAALLGEHDDTVEAWCAEHRCNQVPMWILGHPRLPASLRDFLLAGLASMAGAPRPAGGAHTAEDQANVCTGRTGELLVTLSAALRDKVIDAGEAGVLLPIVRETRRSLEKFEEHLLGALARNARGAA